MASEKEDFRPMDNESTKLRGRVIDELLLRIQSLKDAGKAPPKLWQDNIAALSETDDASFVEYIYEWMVKDLPPKEYQTAEITWETYAMFGNELVDKITMYAARQNLLGAPSQLAAELIVQIFDVRDSVVDAAAAMVELTKIRGRALTELPRFQVMP